MPDITLMGATYPDVPAVTLPSGESTATFYDLGSLDLVTSVNGETGDVTVQPTLVSGTNIKTVNSQSILGSGDLAIQEGTEMVVLAYGKSTWADFEAVYPSAVVYCRASSNSNPASGAQTRMAFMAHVNSENSPTEVEFQYYRSVSSKSATQQGDQVFVYKLNKTNGWSVTVREAYTRITAGTGMTQSYSGGVLTLQAPRELPTVTASDNGKVLGVVNGAWAAALGGGGSDFKLVPVILKSASNYRSTVTIPEVGPDDMVTVFSSFGDAGSFFADYGAANPYVEKNVNGAVTFRLRTNLASPLGVLVAVFSNLELQVFGQDSDIVSNRKPTAGETVTVSSSSAGAGGTRTMYYYDLVTGEEVQYASCTGTTYSGSFTMPNHSVYLRASFSGGGSND